MLIQFVLSKRGAVRALAGALLLASTLLPANQATAAATATDATVPEAPVATKLLRFPAIHGETIVFCHGGDLWKVSSKGGTATRLTAHPGLELFPKISPDGKWVAFTGQYDGDEQVYVIPIEGGQPRQLTFYPSGAPVSPLNGSDNLVYGWTPDGKNIVFRSVRDANAITEFGTLYTVPFEGGLPRKLGMPNAGTVSFSPDGSRVVYSPLFRDFRAWKRYAGGKTQWLSIFDLKTHTEKRLDADRHTQRDPVWVGDKIYFVSDRSGGTLNIFAYDTTTEKVEQITHEKTWDIRWASGDSSGQIVYELAGQIVLFDTHATTPAARFTKLEIKVPHDGLAMRPTRVNVSDRIEQFAPAPGGKRLAVIGRGDLFTVPVDKGYARNLTNTSNAHERHPAYSRDGKTLAYVSDISGEDQIWLRDAKDSAAAPVRLTSKLNAQLSSIKFSPCGRYLTVNDARANLWLIALKDTPVGKRGEPVRIVTARDGGRPNGEWSPCGGYIAYTIIDEQDFGRLYIYDVAQKKHRAVTNPLFDVSSPAWDPAGRYLWFLSRREFAPQFSSVEWNFAGNNNTVLIGLLLRKNVPNPFGPQFDDDSADEPKPAADAKPKNKGTASAAKPVAKADAPKTADNAKTPAPGTEKAAPAPAAAPKPTVIEWNNLAARAVRVPVDASNYSHLTATDKYLFFVKRSAGFYGRGGERPPALLTYDIKARKESVLLPNTGHYELSSDGAFIAASSGGIKHLEARPGATARAINTANLSADRIPAQEWREIYEEVWRKYRDFFYVRNMHGYDWAALGKQYRELLPHVAHRHDLSYVLTELISELNIGHAYIMGGEYYRPRRAKVALPGARFTIDRNAGRYRIAQIYRGQNEEPNYRSPLTEPGVDARVGDYVLAIDGIPLTAAENIYQRLRDHTDPVTLTLNTKPTLDGARKATYVPLESEAQLRYLNAVLRNYDYVNRKTGGRVGYLHIPDMGGPGAYEFIKWYYPQIRKEGLVIDARGNRGGNISQWLIMRLNQKLLGTRFGGPSQTADAYPGLARHGSQVCLINESAGSDGDIFPWYFRQAGLGPLIGKRTWGGVVGISDVGALLDGGSVTVPLRGTNDANGNWIIEGHGVDPDIEVENDAKSMISGRDPQLERGIEEVLKRVKDSPKTWPKRPADPVKTKGR